MNKELLRLAIPNILSNISVPLLSTVDTILMGSLSAGHLGAVGVGSMIFNFIYWNFGFLRMGTTGMTAQAFGQKDASEQIHILMRAVSIGLFLGLAMIILSRPIESLSILAFNVENNQADLVRQYFSIRIWAAPASLIIYGVTGWFFGMQNAIYPLIITLVVNVVNMLLSIFLVQELGLGISGVAWGTVAAQYLGLLVGLLLFVFKYLDLSKHIKASWKSAKDFIKFLKINSDIFIRTVCLTLAFSFFYAKSAEGGEIILAVNVILLQLLNWMSYGVDGFSYAAESMVGKYFGAKDEANTYKAMKYSFGWGAGLAIVFSLLYLFFYTPIIQIFSTDASILDLALEYRWWMALFPIIAFSCYLWDGIYIGLTASASMRNTMLISMLIYLIAYYLLKDLLPVKAIWLSLMILLFTRGLIQTLFFYRYKLALR